jgi:hypothetical protein
VVENSWWLKLDRAEEHFRDLTDEILRYANTHPYRAVRVPPPKQQPDIRLYKLEITQQPHARISVPAGDVVHNARTIFDHLAVAVTGRRDAAFPVCYEDQWEALGDGSLMPERAKARASFESAVAGADPAAVAIIKEMQPYSAGENWPTHPLGIINKLENTDKHRTLIATTTGITEGLSHVARRSAVVFIFYWPFCDDGAEVAKFRWEPGAEPPDAEVHVRVSGTPRVTVEVSGIGGPVDLAPTLRHALDGLREEAIPSLEPFVKS